MSIVSTESYVHTILLRPLPRFKMGWPDAYSELVLEFIVRANLPQELGREVVPPSGFIVLIDRRVGNGIAAFQLHQNACARFFQGHKQSYPIRDIHL